MSILEVRDDNYRYYTPRNSRIYRNKLKKEAMYKSIFIEKHEYNVDIISTFNKEYTNMSHNKEVGIRYLQYISNNHNIDVDRKKMSGMPVIKQTRIPVSLIIECLKEEIKIDDIASDYYLTKEQVINSLEYVIDILNRPFNEDR